MPDDPHGDGVCASDECSAIGVAVLDCFADGDELVIVTHRSDGGYNVYGHKTSDSPNGPCVAEFPDDGGES